MYDSKSTRITLIKVCSTTDSNHAIADSNHAIADFNYEKCGVIQAALSRVTACVTVKAKGGNSHDSLVAARIRHSRSAFTLATRLTYFINPPPAPRLSLTRSSYTVTYTYFTDTDLWRCSGCTDERASERARERERGRERERERKNKKIR